MSDYIQLNLKLMTGYMQLLYLKLMTGYMQLNSYLMCDYMQLSS
jgi:hypothetical protein